MAKILTVGNSVISGSGSQSGVSKDVFNQHVNDTMAHTTQDDKTKINKTANDLTTHTTDKTNPHETKISQLEDVEITSLLDKQSLVYDATKGKYVNKFVSSTSDEKVKLTSTSTDAKYLNELLDNSTIVAESEKLIVKKIENMLATVDEINYLQGLDENIMDKLSKVVNGGLTIYKNKSFTTYAELLTFDFTTFPTTIGYLCYVINDENHLNQCTAYLCDKTTNNTSNLPTYFGTMNVTPRDFSTDKLDLTSEVKGVLPQENVDLAGVVKDVDLSDYMKANDFTGVGTTPVNIAKTLSNLTCTVSDINNSVNKSHEHNNKTVIDKFTEVDGNPYYNGNPIATKGVFEISFDDTTKELTITQIS